MHVSRQWRRSTLSLMMAGCFAVGSVHANPVGPQVINGQVTFTNQGNTLSIFNTPGAVINWQSFSIDGNEVTRFIQQSASSAVLNRIVGQDPSKILGALQSNGKVFLINPNGVLFGQGAKVDVNGLVASTLDISNADFTAGRYNFKAGATAGSVKNQGAITTPAGGQVFLIAPNVENSGVITSPKGDVVLAAGHTVSLVDSSNPDVQVVVSAPEHEALNLGQVVAEGGRIGIYGALVTQKGLVSANSAVVGENGKIVFKASRDTILGAGSVTTATGAGKGGEIEVLGERVGLTGNAQIDASGQAGGGTVLIGGDYQGRNSAIQNAARVFVSTDAVIRADALARGDGGKIIVWSQEVTRAYGSISARGGALGGNGGFVETSGHYLDTAGVRVDGGAPKGKVGTWLLDPYDIAVVATGGSTDLTQFDQFADLPVIGTSSVNASAISAATAGVVLEATHDITFSGAINIAASGVGLSAYAGNNINVNSRITTNGGSIYLSANDSGGPASGSGSLTVSAAISGSTVSLSSGGDLTINAGVTGTLYPSLICDCQSGVHLTSSNGAITGSGTVTAPSVNATSQTGMSLNTAVSSLYATNTGSTGNISVTNSGALTITGISQPIQLASGSINVNNTGALTVSGSITTDSGGISLQAHSPLTVNGSVTSNSGNISLTAGSSGTLGSGDTLTIGSAATVTTSGSISLWAGDGIVIQSGATLSPGYSQSAYNNPAPLPSLSDCIANPSLSGCSSVLPTLSQCIASPTTAGCSVVLPTLSQCMANPALSGCSVVLPSLATCVSAPTTSGCSAVLPTLAQCMADMSLPGCTVVLPSLATCISAPTTPGCSVILPSLASCVANPTQTGCSVVLPSLAQCIASPTLTGCSVVLPSLASCIATPTLSGCSVVLPTLSQCIAAPATTGCSVVLPTLAQCIAAPTQAGCSVVLPTLSSCIATPTLAGCAVVLPTLDQCISLPTLAGCSVVLPTLAQCAATPTMAGCSVVLPAVSTCSVAPTTAGCTGVLPTAQTPDNVPVNRTLDTLVASVNTTVVRVSSVNSSSATSTTSNTGNSDKKKQTDTIATNNSGATKNDAPAPKMYCN